MRTTSVITGISGALLFGAGVYAGLNGTLPDLSSFRSAPVGEYRPSYEVVEGQEIALVFIGSSAYRLLPWPNRVPNRSEGSEQVVASRFALPEPC